jgi:hypothetical protein
LFSFWKSEDKASGNSKKSASGNARAESNQQQPKGGAPSSTTKDQYGTDGDLGGSRKSIIQQPTALMETEFPEFIQSLKRTR